MDWGPVLLGRFRLNRGRARAGRQEAKRLKLCGIMVPDVSGSRKSRSEPPSERLELAVGDNRSCSIHRGTCSNFTVCCSTAPLRLLIARPYMLAPRSFPTRSFLVSRSSSPSIADELRYCHVHTSTSQPASQPASSNPGTPLAAHSAGLPAAAPGPLAAHNCRRNPNSFQLDTPTLDPVHHLPTSHLQGVNRAK